MENQETKLTPAEYLAKIPGAPSADAISAAKAQAPGGRIALVTTQDSKGAYVVRAISGLETEKALSSVPANSSDKNREYALAVVSLCTIWTNMTPTGKYDRTSLLAGPAGTAETLFTKIMSISNYMDPESLEIFSGDL